MKCSICGREIVKRPYRNYVTWKGETVGESCYQKLLSSLHTDTIRGDISLLYDFEGTFTDRTDGKRYAIKQHIPEGVRDTGYGAVLDIKELPPLKKSELTEDSDTAMTHWKYGPDVKAIFDDWNREEGLFEPTIRLEAGRISCQAGPAYARLKHAPGTAFELRMQIIPERAMVYTARESFSEEGEAMIDFLDYLDKYFYDFVAVTEKSKLKKRTEALIAKIRAVEGL